MKVETAAPIAEAAQEPEQVGTEPNPDGFFPDLGDATACSVRVAVRARPLIGKELFERSTICVKVREEDNQIQIGKDRTFSFDRVFGLDSRQESVFEACVKNLVLGCFVGFNATILAYGQTGAGKTHTMGSGSTLGLSPDDYGLIPRVIQFIFQEVELRKNKAEFIIKCSFLEIYNEELHDLLEDGGGTVMDQIMPSKKEISIREEKNGMISVYGLREVTVKSADEMARQLDQGSSMRITSSTLMNSQSSRSHGIFTITIEQHMIDDLGAVEGQEQAEKRDEFMVAKFHFVDLAGSERAKKTEATGLTLKEGISINKGLLSLGNVISALTEESKKNHHVPYRDSKLTRILQDSLGGNSRTVMIACCSPAETNFDETLNTLKYANRARNIKNKPVVNRDPASIQIAQLRQQVYDLQKELLSSRKLLQTNNIDFEEINELPPEAQFAALGKQIQANMTSVGLQKQPVTNTGGGINISNSEIKRMESQISELKAQVTSKDKEIKTMTLKYDSLNDQFSQTQILQFEAQKERDISRFQLETLVDVLKKKNLYEEVVKEINGGVLPAQNGESTDDQIFNAAFGNSGPTVLEEYQLKVEEQTRELSNLTLKLKNMQTDNSQLIEQATRDTKSLENKELENERMKRANTKLQKELADLKLEHRKLQQDGGKGRPTQIARRGTTKIEEKKEFNPYDEDPLAALSSSFNPSQARTRVGQSVYHKRPVTMKRGALDNPPQHWLSDELESKVRNFDEIRKNFINDLTDQMSNLLIADVPERQRSMTISSGGKRPILGSSPEKRKSEMITGSNMGISSPEKRKSEMIKRPGVHDTPERPEFAIERITEQDEEIEQSQMTNKEVDSDVIFSSSDSDHEVPEDGHHINESMQQNNNMVDESMEQNTLVQERAQEAEQKDKQEEEEVTKKETEVKQMDEKVKEKEQLLNMFKQSQRELEGSLIEAMKEEYHNKIREMDEELKRLEQQKNESISKTQGNAQKSKIEDQFKKKEVELQGKLKELKQKELDQAKTQKNLNQQKKRVQELEKEIDVMKTQKVTMMKKVKEATDNHAALKKQRAQELASLKKQLLKKERENDKLKRDYKKKDIFAKRKQEELNAMQIRVKMDEKKKKDAAKVRNQSKQIDLAKIRNWILENTSTMVDYHELQSEKFKEEEQCQEIESRINEEQKQYARLSVQVEKLMQRKKSLEMAEEGTQDDEIFETEQEIQEISHQMESIQDHIDSLEEKQSFYAGKITELSKELIGTKPNNVDSMVFEDVQTLDGARAIIGTFFQVLLDLQLRLREAVAEVDSKQIAIESLNEQFLEIKSDLEMKDTKYKRDVEQIQQTWIDKERMLVQLIIEKAAIDVEQILGQSQENDQTQATEINLIDLVDYLLKISRANNNGESVFFKHELELLKNTANAGIKKGLNAKAEVREGKKEQVKETKAAISKKNTELQKTNQEKDIEINRLKRDLHNQKMEKAKFKRYYENELAEKKKDYDSKGPTVGKLNLQPVLQQQKSAGSAYIHPAILNANNAVQNIKKMQDFKEMRENRKMRKMTVQTGSQKYLNPLNSSRSNNNMPSTSPRKTVEHLNESVDVLYKSNHDTHERDLEGRTDVFSRLTGSARQRKAAGSQSELFKGVSVSGLGKQGSNTFIERGRANTNLNNTNILDQTDPFTEKALSEGSEIQNIEAAQWEMAFDKQDAHKSRVYCVKAVGNQLYSTADKSLKIWDLETMKYIADLPEKIGLVKAIAYWKERNLLLTAAEKSIMLWDVISLTNVGVMKGHKEEIKDLQLVPGSELLFAASKGSSNTSGLMVYDLRKSQLLYEKEKNQDVFSLAATDQTVFYGCRNHTVHPFDLQTQTSLSPLQPPHFDVVTSLALLGGGRTLVSGSRDKNLRCYDLTSPNFEHVGAVMTAHSDQINTLATDSEQTNLYSGGRDGIVKIWNLQTISDPYSQIQPQELQCTASLEGNAQRQPVNTICNIDADPNTKAFAVGSNDRSIRIWKQSQGMPEFEPESLESQMLVRDLGSSSEASGFTQNQLDMLNELQIQKEQFDQKHDERRGILLDNQSAHSGGSSMLMQLRKHKKQKKNQDSFKE